MTTDSAGARRAQHGEKMLEVKVRFWTDGIAGEGKIRPKHACASGIVRLKSNPAHGIKSPTQLTFNSLLELPGVIEKLLIEEGITLHVTAKMRKYLADEKVVPKE
jgi:hypothetical protein